MKYLPVGKYEAAALPLWSKSALQIYEAKRSKMCRKAYFIAEGNLMFRRNAFFG